MLVFANNFYEQWLPLIEFVVYEVELYKNAHI